jgi:hypothetical protein
MMKAFRLLLPFLCILFLLNGPVFALSIGSGGSEIQVGSWDYLIAQTTLSSSDVKDEELWIQGVLGDTFTVTDDDKYDVSSNMWDTVNGINTGYALELQGLPEYYFIKLGVGQTTLPNTHYLYDNLDSLQYAVINIADWGATSMQSINIGRVSHVGEIQGDLTFRTYREKFPKLSTMSPRAA